MRPSPAFPLSRRGFGVAAALAAAGACVPALRAQSRREREKVTIAVGGKARFAYLPLTIAEQMGFFRAEGLEVEIRDFATGSQALQAVLSGIADVCSGAFEHTVSLQSKGKSFRSIVLQGRAPQIVMGASTRTLAGYRGLRDLQGRRIGIPAPGGASHMMATLVLARAGLKPGDAEFVALGTPSAAASALRAGQIDAVSVTDPVATTLEQKADIRVVCDTRTLKGTLDLFGGPMPAGCLHAPEDFVQKRSATAQALASGMVHALKWLQTAGPGDIVKTVPEPYLLGDRALYLTVFHKMREGYSPDGLVPEGGPETAVRAMAGFDPAVQLGRIDLPRLYTNDFAQRAKDRFQA
ncbi:ABC transporter substrate-binding protein [Xylophilus sp. Leaf220]|uniref:ABC transporter substrate-binding protein n=1 Tax=Xylophilus sp. Leaf220 TaxID=1735686 RepID=UPI000A75322A|nr:ABC transporter substrate-binding protein [Xylophilus sp. Leaf220]